ncbi:MAG: DinB family protein [Flammeovirgaceae bacterium]
MLPFITKIKTTLHDVFERADLWFEEDPLIRNYRPASDRWTINEILEHISLTSHFLLILIDKGAKKSLKNLHNLDVSREIEYYQFGGAKLDEIAIHQAFEWIRPEHMEPTGEKSLPEIQQIFAEQLRRCLVHLETMPNGEGVLYKTTMTVNDLGKIDVYEYIYFLAMHIERHITQMEKNKKEFLNQN